MSQFPQALYKFGGVEKLEDGDYTSKLAHDAADLESSLADGWHETTAAAKAAHIESNQGETSLTDAGPERDGRAELEKQAIDLGLKFDARTSDKKLRERIDEAMAGSGGE